QDADHDALGGAPAVALEVELAFEGLVDGLDDLPQWLEVLASRGFRLAFAGGPEQDRAAAGEGGFEAAAVVSLVADDDLPGLPGQVLVPEDVQQDLPLVRLR